MSFICGARALESSWGEGVCNNKVVSKWDRCHYHKSNLVDYAREELERAGLFDLDSDYNGMIADAVMEVVDKYADQGHSGMSASWTLSLAEKLLRFKPITPLTYEIDEWNDVSKESGRPMWQNRRDSEVFSTDGGLTHYSLSDPPKKKWWRRG